MPLRFRVELGRLSNRFYLPEEFPKLRRKTAAKKEADRAASQPAGSLTDYAFALTGKALDDLIYSLVLKPETKVKYILEVRFTKRLAGLSWTLFQYNPSCITLPELMSAAGLEPDDFPTNGGRLMLCDGFQSDPAEAAVCVMLAECTDAKTFVTRYGIIKESPFYKDVIELFFSRCNPQVLTANFEMFTDFISTHPAPGESAAVKHYLMSLEPSHYHVPLNLLLIERLGMPSVTPEKWDYFTKEAVNKMDDWYKIYILNEALRKPGRKHSTLTSHIGRIKAIQYSSEDGILRLNFGNFSLFDPDPKSDETFLFINPEKGMVITREEFMSCDNISDAREFVLEWEEADAYKLAFFEFEKLYAEEMLEICLGLAIHYEKVSEESRQKGGVHS